MMAVRLSSPHPQPLTIRRIILGLAATAALLTMTGRADPQGATSSPLGGCAEDDPCWDCQTMGNHVCGPASSEESATP